jgi:uncharacterized membrane protein
VGEAGPACATLGRRWLPGVAFRPRPFPLTPDQLMNSPQTHPGDLLASRRSKALPPPRRIPASRCLFWIQAGCSNLIARPILWLLTGLISFVLLFLFSLLATVVPVLGPMLPVIALVIIVSGLLQAAAHQARGETPGLSEVFTTLRAHITHLGLLGFFFSLPLSLLSLMGFLAAGGTLVAGLLGAAMGSALNTVAGWIVGVITYLVATAALFIFCWALLMLSLFFAPALVMFDDVAPLDAMAHSFRASVQNFGAILGFAAILTLLFVVAMLAAGFGIIVLIPIFAGALFEAYRDVFAPLANDSPEVTTDAG